ncbi:MAG: hypothetical protein ACI4J1_09265 [Ruminiclostridium sp.]
MKLNLTQEEVMFIKNELGVNEEKLNSISKEEWKSIREKCFNIDVEEAIKQELTGGEYSRRGEVADKIIDKKYSQLFIL